MCSNTATKPKDTSVVLRRSIALLYCSALLPRSNASLYCFALLLYFIVPLYCSALLLRPTALLYRSALLRRSTAPQSQRMCRLLGELKKLRKSESIVNDATRCRPGTVRDPLDVAGEDDDASDELSEASGNDGHTEDAAGSVGAPAPKQSDLQLNQFETTLGLDPTAAPDFVQHVAAFKA